MILFCMTAQCVTVILVGLEYDSFCVVVFYGILYFYYSVHFNLVNCAFDG
jgi:uncharacterized membrane protein